MSPASEPVDRDVLDAHRAEEFHLVAAGLRDEALGEVSAADALRESRVVVDALGDARLAAQPAALDHDGVDALARRVDRGGEARRSAADDRQVVAATLGLEREPELAARAPRWSARRARRSRRRRSSGSTGRPFCNSSTCCSAGCVLVDVDPVVFDPLLGEKSLRPLAVRAPRGAVDGDLRHQVRRVRSALTPTSVPRKRSTMLPFASMMITVGGSMTLYSEAIDFACVVDARIGNLVAPLDTRRHWRCFHVSSTPRKITPLRRPLRRKRVELGLLGIARTAP